MSASTAYVVWAVDLILLLVALETLALVLLWRWKRRGLAPARLLPTMLAGGCLLLAFRAVLGGASLAWIGAALAAAGIAHFIDLRSRWR